jgi:hypothetical protein
MLAKRRAFLGAALAAIGTNVLAPDALFAAAPAGAVTPEQFGAKGDAVTDDSVAFRRAALEIQQNGGGVLWLRPVIYRVGAQSGARGGYAFAPTPLIEIRGCIKPVVISGNGATLRCTAGLRYGLFDPASGAPLRNKMPFYEAGYSAVPYTAMIAVEGCSAAVKIADLELDGNLPTLKIGGPWGDTGWQLPCVGLRLADNIGSELIRNVRSHRHAQDGLIINGPVGPSANTSRRIQHVRLEGNGRQGCSLVGGANYLFSDCLFSTTGTGKIMSAPGAGLDIEAEGRTIRAIRFVGCRFAGTVGCAMVADTGDTEDVEFSKCTFVAGNSWAAWPNKPRLRFLDCSFVGPVTRCYGDDDVRRAASFVRCRFTDMVQVDRAGRRVPPGPMVDMSDARNVQFNQCSFTIRHGGALPWSTGAIYRSCTMLQPTSGRQGYPRGRFEGVGSIVGNVDIAGSKIIGALTINGASAH